MTAGSLGTPLLLPHLPHPQRIPLPPPDPDDRFRRPDIRWYLVLLYKLVQRAFLRIELLSTGGVLLLVLLLLYEFHLVDCSWMWVTISCWTALNWIEFESADFGFRLSARQRQDDCVCVQEIECAWGLAEEEINRKQQMRDCLFLLLLDALYSGRLNLAPANSTPLQSLFNCP